MFSNYLYECCRLRCVTSVLRALCFWRYFQFSSKKQNAKNGSTVQVLYLVHCYCAVRYAMENSGMAHIPCCCLLSAHCSLVLPHTALSSAHCLLMIWTLLISVACTSLGYSPQAPPFLLTAVLRSLVHFFVDGERTTNAINSASNYEHYVHRVLLS